MGGQIVINHVAVVGDIDWKQGALIPMRIAVYSGTATGRWYPCDGDAASYASGGIGCTRGFNNSPRLATVSAGNRWPRAIHNPEPRLLTMGEIPNRAQSSVGSACAGNSSETKGV